MRKLLALALVAVLSTSSFAYIPLSNSQSNLGSFRNGATRGMFYEEIDVLSASPVSLMEFAGNSLYTNWGNLRYSNSPVGAVGAVPINGGADRAFTYDATGRSQYFNFGLIGNPLSYLGIDDSRSGFVYQNYGAKNVALDLDNDATTGTGGGLDSEGQWSNTALAATALTIDRIIQSNSNLKYYDNNTNTQWNTGIAYKGLILSDLIVGFSIANEANSNMRSVGGTKTYTDRYLNATGAGAGGMPATATIGDTYTVAFANKDFNVNSNATTDLLAQGRLPILGLLVDGALGMRFQNSYNPLVGVVVNGSAVDPSASMTLTGSEDIAIGGVQYFDQATVLRTRTGSGVDYTNFVTPAAFPGTVGSVTARNGLFSVTAGAGVNKALTAYNDERTGTGPLLRLEALKEWSKVNLTGIFNLSSVKQNVGAQLDYADQIIYRYYNAADATQIRNYTATDYSQSVRWNGDNTITRMDFGGKMEFKALEGMKLAVGGFIQNNGDKMSVNTPIESVERVSFSDGVAGDTPYVVVNTASKPSPGAGEGAWQQTISSNGTYTMDVASTRYVVPVGVEIKLAKKWTLGCGTQYVMTKTTTKERTSTDLETTVTVQTPAGGATTTTSAVSANPSSSESTYYTESHAVQYTYGVRYVVNKNLTLACNAFLDTAANANPAGNAARANLLDLDTYRLIALQAVFHF